MAHQQAHQTEAAVLRRHVLGYVTVSCPVIMITAGLAFRKSYVNYVHAACFSPLHLASKQLLQLQQWVNGSGGGRVPFGTSKHNPSPQSFQYCTSHHITG